jgi:RND superfamily putative drug exporter
MNLLSIAAAYGVVTAVFQWGWGASLIGLDGPVPIESYVPMMMFAVLFGLSMDYEVFLLTAFREQWERTGDMVVAVRRGLADTGRVVTAAALIMTVVFASFILSDNVVVKMFGVGLSTAVIVDATIVRCLLVPAVMVLAARGTWWLPGWLDRLLPHLRVEGDPVALDAVAAGAPARHHRDLTLLAGGATALVGVLLGVLTAWVLGSRLPGLPDGGTTAVAVSAVLGGLLVLVPALRPGSRTPLLARAAGLVLGGMLALVVVSVLEAIVPPLAPSRTVLTAWALLAVCLLAALLAGRSFGLPVAIGGIAVAVAVTVVPVGVTGLALAGVALLPALVAMLVAAGYRAVVLLARRRDPGTGTGAPVGAADEPDREAAEVAR